LIAIAALCLGSATSVFAQGADERGVIAGTIFGPDGARLPGVSVSVADESVVLARVVSGEQGSFRVSALHTGQYEVSAELHGFRPMIASVDVSSGRVTTVDVSLSIETLKESITVVGALPRDSLEAPKIIESGARDVGESLGVMPGVWKVRRGAIASDLVLRGYQGDNVTVLIDGVRLYGACPSNMDHTAFHVDFAEVDRIEIGKGPFDVKNQGALGGVVNIVTKRPGSGFHFTPQVAFGSSGYVNPSATASFGIEHLAMLGGFSHRAADPYVDGSGRSFLSVANYRASAQQHHAFDVNTGWGRVDLVPSQANNIALTVTRQRAGTVFYPYLQMDAVYDNADRVKAGWDVNRRFGPVRAMRTEAYVTRVEHFMTDEYRLSSAASSTGYSMAALARTGSAGVRGEAVLTDVTVGFEGYHRDWSTEGRTGMAGALPVYSIPDAGLSSLGIFVDYARPIARSLGLSLGGRLDRTDTSADPAKANIALYQAYHGVASTSASDVYPSGKMRVTWQAHPAIVVTGGVGRSVRVPDPQERYFGQRRMGTDWVGDPSLRPTSNTGVDVGVTVRRPRGYLNATFHRDMLGDFIIAYQQPQVAMVAGSMNLVARSYRNIDATMSGGEIEGVLTVTDRLFVAGDVSSVRGRRERDPAAGILSGNLAEIPPTRSRLAVRYDLSHEHHGIFAEAEAIYSASQTSVDTDVQETPTPGYTLINLRVGGTVRLVRLAFGVGNLLNRTYVEHLSYQRDPFRAGVRVFEPGRNIYTNVTVAF
jgi:iron complex outermembrane recepter protein